MGQSRIIDPKDRVRQIIEQAGLSSQKTYKVVGQGKFGLYKNRMYRFSAIVAAVLVLKKWITIEDPR